MLLIVNPTRPPEVVAKARKSQALTQILWRDVTTVIFVALGNRVFMLGMEPPKTEGGIDKQLDRTFVIAVVLHGREAMDERLLATPRNSLRE
jgi:hypothetical protein